MFAALVEDLVKTSGRTLSQPQGVRWGSWETWSSCSQQCSRGFRTRKRSCSTAEGRTNPSACVGSPVEYQDCNIQPCPGEQELQAAGSAFAPESVPDANKVQHVCCSGRSLVLLGLLVPVLSQLWGRTLPADSDVQQPPSRQRRRHLHRPAHGGGALQHTHL